MNKDTKTPGRTTRFLTNIGVVQRWEINASYRVSLRRCIHYLLQFEQKNVKHKDLTKSRISRDEKDVKSVYNVLSAIFIPRFSEQLLVSISTGTVVAESEADKVMEAYVNGKTAMQSFIDNRLSNNPKTHKRNIDLKILLAYPLGCVPLSLAEADGSLRKTAKSFLFHKFEGDVEPIKCIPKDCAYVIDGMAAKSITNSKTYIEKTCQ